MVKTGMLRAPPGGVRAVSIQNNSRYSRMPSSRSLSLSLSLPCSVPSVIQSHFAWHGTEHNNSSSNMLLLHSRTLYTHSYSLLSLSALTVLYKESSELHPIWRVLCLSSSLHVNNQFLNVFFDYKWWSAQSLFSSAPSFPFASNSSSTLGFCTKQQRFPIH